MDPSRVEPAFEMAKRTTIGVQEVESWRILHAPFMGSPLQISLHPARHLSSALSDDLPSGNKFAGKLPGPCTC